MCNIVTTHREMMIRNLEANGMPVVYIIFKLNKDELKVELSNITKNKDLIPDDSLYHVVYGFNYVGRNIVVAPGKGIRLKSLIHDNLLKMLNSSINNKEFIKEPVWRKA